MSDVKISVSAIAGKAIEEIKHEMERRSYLAANELRNASQMVLRGQRNGRRYRVPNSKVYYTASAPGEPPAVRTGAFRMSWQPSAYVDNGSYVSRVSSDVQVGTRRKYILGDLLENGTSRMAPRPHQQEIVDKATPEIVKIYSKNYF